jgi:acyl-homoserine lactone acylase PvdQ
MKIGFFAFCSLIMASAFAQSPSQAEVKRWEAQAKQVNIVRDTYGVPHIYGKTDADVVFGLMFRSVKKILNALSAIIWKCWEEELRWRASAWFTMIY